MDRYHVICESLNIFLSFSSGHGSGREVVLGGGESNCYKGDETKKTFCNQRKCSRFFGNAEGSFMTMGGGYLTGTVNNPHRGVMVDAKGQSLGDYYRKFIPYEGQDEENKNSMERDIGGHASNQMNQTCFRHMPGDPRATNEHVLHGMVVDFTNGRSNGCNNWSASTAEFIARMVQNEPTSLYMYPQRADIEKLQKALLEKKSPAQDGVHWNGECLKEIGYPVFVEGSRTLTSDEQFQEERLRQFQQAGIPETKLFRFKPELTTLFKDEDAAEDRTWTQLYKRFQQSRPKPGPKRICPEPETPAPPPVQQ